MNCDSIHIVCRCIASGCFDVYSECISSPLPCVAAVRTEYTKMEQKLQDLQGKVIIGGVNLVSSKHYYICVYVWLYCMYRAGATGTAATAMAVLYVQGRRNWYSCYSHGCTVCTGPARLVRLLRPWLYCMYRAGATGTAATVMAVPLFATSLP